VLIVNQPQKLAMTATNGQPSPRGRSPQTRAYHRASASCLSTYSSPALDRAVVFRCGSDPGEPAASVRHRRDGTGTPILSQGPPRGPQVLMEAVYRQRPAQSQTGPSFLCGPIGDVSLRSCGSVPSSMVSGLDASSLHPTCVASLRRPFGRQLHQRHESPVPLVLR